MGKIKTNKINEQIQQIQAKTETAQSFLKDKSFETYKGDYSVQGKILNNLNQAKELCYDLGLELIKQYGWKKTVNLEKILYLLQEKDVIDSDLVDQMIAMYRLRRDLIEDNLEKGDFKLVDEILQQNFEDIHLFIKEVEEFISTANDEQ